MKNAYVSMLAVLLGGIFLCLPVHALFGEDAGQAGGGADEVTADDGGQDVDARDIESKLVKLTTLEDAFLKGVRKRNLLQRYIVQESRKLEEAEDNAVKGEIQKNIVEARKRLQIQAVAMDVIFGIGRRREYEYNQVTSTVYLRVGTVEEAFARAVRTRDALQQFLRQQQALLEAEKDEAEKAEIQKKIDAAVTQFRTVAASLQAVFGVAPQRNYHYNPKDSTLYLRISENELDKLKEQVAKMQREQEEKATATGAADAE